MNYADVGAVLANMDLYAYAILIGLCTGIGAVLISLLVILVFLRLLDKMLTAILKELHIWPALIEFVNWKRAKANMAPIQLKDEELK